MRRINEIFKIIKKKGLIKLRRMLNLFFKFVKKFCYFLNLFDDNSNFYLFQKT